MPSAWKKTLTYLGLVEDEEYDELDEVEPDELVGERGAAADKEEEGESHR